MELAAGTPQRGAGLERLAAHLALLDDPVTEPARERLDRAIGSQLAQFLVGALSSHPFPARAAAAA
jgi:hypothetical protein